MPTASPSLYCLCASFVELRCPDNRFKCQERGVLSEAEAACCMRPVLEFLKVNWLSLVSLFRDADRKPRQDVASFYV